MDNWHQRYEREMQDSQRAIDLLSTAKMVILVVGIGTVLSSYLW